MAANPAGARVSLGHRQRRGDDRGRSRDARPLRTASPSRPAALRPPSSPAAARRGSRLIDSATKEISRSISLMRKTSDLRTRLVESSYAGLDLRTAVSIFLLEEVKKRRH